MRCLDHPGNLGGSDSWRMQGHGGTEEVPGRLRERAVKMVFEIRERDGKGHRELARVGRPSAHHLRLPAPGLAA